MKKIVDLSQTYTSNYQGYSRSICKTLELDGWNASTLTFYSHCGTHMDAPTHFGAGAQTIDQIPIEDLLGGAWVVDLRSIGPRGLIRPDDVTAGISENFRQGDSLLLWTGWSQFVDQPAYRDDLPRVSEDLAQWCVSHKVKMLGVEPPSVADVNNLEEVTRIHQILLGEVIIIEGLINLDKLTSNYVELIALPLKIDGGDGSPARVLAIEHF